MIFDATEKFKLVKNKMQSLVTAINFDLWIDSLKLAEYDNTKEEKVLILLAPTKGAKDRILRDDIYQNLVISINENFLSNTTLTLLSIDEYDELKEKRAKEKKAENKSQKVNQTLKKENNFNPKYTFDTFVIGKSNQFVAAAMESVAHNPASQFNPLFIYGGSGLGKTHLMHAVGNYLQENRPELNVVYVTCEKFTNSYISSLYNSKSNPSSSFREKYRTADLLMIDDIQFMSNKMGIQEEFFHTFNDLYQLNKQIIIASDRSPKDMSALEERLRSRFSSGLIQDMQIPDYETRVAILQKKAGLEGYIIDNEVINYIASKLDTNVREMEGALSKVVFYAQLLGKESAGMDEVYEALRDQDETKKISLSADTIIDIVCDFYKISRSDITGKKKTKEIVNPRQIAIFLICDMISMPLIAIGQLFGGRDHTTIMHARDKVGLQIKSNNNIKLQINDIKARLNNK